MQERSADRRLKVGSPSFHQKNWITAIFGQALIGIFVVASIVGLFGGGIYSDVSRQSTDATVQANFARITRYQSPSEIRLAIDGDVTTNGTAAVHLSRSFTDHIEISSISPEPESVAINGDALTYSFEVESGQDKLTATFYITVERIGRISGEISAGDGEPVHISQFVFP